MFNLYLLYTVIGIACYAEQEEFECNEKIPDGTVQLQTWSKIGPWNYVHELYVAPNYAVNAVFRIKGFGNRQCKDVIPAIFKVEHGENGDKVNRDNPIKTSWV